MKPSWRGVVGFGLVNIPVKLYPAVRVRNVVFELLDKRNLSPVQMIRINKETGEEIPAKEVVRGVKYEEDKYVVIPEKEIQKATAPKSKVIEVMQFTGIGQIPTKYYMKPYYVVPEEEGEKLYVLFREALKQTEKIGVVKLVMRGKEYVASLESEDEAIILNLLRFESEINDKKDFDLPSRERITDKELELAKRLIERLAMGFRPDKYSDLYGEGIRKYIEERARQGQIKERGDEPKATKPEELELRLRESLRD